MATQITNRDDFKAFCTDNKYCKWYFNIIDKALARGWTKKTSQVYVESHHIILEKYFIQGQQPENFMLGRL
jgi:hypothetical protein